MSDEEGEEEGGEEEEADEEEQEDDEEEQEAEDGTPSKLKWSKEILKAISTAGLGDAMRPIVPAIEEVFALAGTVSSFLIINRLAKSMGPARRSARLAAKSGLRQSACSPTR